MVLIGFVSTNTLLFHKFYIIFRNPSGFVEEDFVSVLLFTAQIDHNIHHSLIVFTIAVEVWKL